jgi:hypothetical protein
MPASQAGTLTCSSQATGVLSASHRPASELVAYSHRPPRPLGDVLAVWREWRASVPPPRPPAPVMVELPRHLLN